MQEILCLYILWQYSDIEKSLTLLKNEMTMLKFLTLCFESDTATLKRFLNALKDCK